MTRELLALLHEDAKTARRDPRVEDLTPEQRAAIVPAREVGPPPPELPRKSVSAADDPPVRMDPVIVEEPADPSLRLELADLARQSAAEQKTTEPTLLDRILNHPRISLLGGYNAQTRAAIARRRLKIIEFERMVLLAIAFAETEAEKEELRGYLWELRAMRR